MANKYRGEVEVEIGGKRRILKFSINEVTALEQQAGMPVSRFFSAENAGISTIHIGMYFGLKHYNPRVTKAQVGDWMTKELRDKGSEALNYFGERVGYAISWFFDPTAEKRDKSDPDHPLFEGVSEPQDQSPSTVQQS
jgi:hypothetical protein